MWPQRTGETQRWALSIAAAEGGIRCPFLPILEPLPFRVFAQSLQFETLRLDKNNLGK